MSESVTWFTNSGESRVNAKNEELSNMISRRRLFAALGASVLLVTAASYLRADNEQLSENKVIQNSPEASHNDRETYPVHDNIITTVFWVGEAGDEATNDNIHNRSSVWVEDWVGSYGGVDDPNDRCGYRPCDFDPRENPFYFALPFNDFGDNGLKSEKELEVIPWYDGNAEEGEWFLKNRWIEITYNDKKAYAQWEDAGPFGEDDADYVFGTASPKEERAGLDVSPAVADYLEIDGRGTVSWRFISDQDVPDGPWKEIVTISGPRW
jgi:hypothetical protein